MKKSIFTIAILFSLFSVMLCSCEKDSDTDKKTDNSSFDFIDLGTHLDGSSKTIFINENEGWVLGIKDASLIALNTLIYTDDGGSTWKTMNTELPAAQDEIKFVNSTDGYLIDNSNNVRYTTDKGANWTGMTIPNPDNYILDFYATASNSTTTVMLARVDRTWSTLYFVSNATHEVTNSVVINDMLYPGHNMHLSEAGAITIGPIERTGNDFKEIAYSADNGASWTYTKIVSVGKLGTEAWVCDLSFPDDNTGFFTAQDKSVYDNAYLYKTTNGGSSWSKISIPGSVAHYNFYHISFANTTHGLATSGGSIHKTTDGGDTWTELSYFGDNYITTSSVSYPVQGHGFLCSINGATDGSNGLYIYAGQ